MRPVGNVLDIMESGRVPREMEAGLADSDNAGHIPQPAGLAAEVGGQPAGSRDGNTGIGASGGHRSEAGSRRAASTISARRQGEGTGVYGSHPQGPAGM